MNELITVKIVNRTLEIYFKDGNTIVFEDCWLRDNCRCSQCYRAETYQRAIHLLHVPESTIASVEYHTAEVIITWDDEHISKYKASYLAQFHFKSWVEKRRLTPILWKGDEVADGVVRVRVGEFLNSVDGAKAVFQSLLDYGVALITEVEASLESTEEVCQALGGVQHTLFGGMWQFTTQPQHADSAYTDLPLAAHNDNTYLTEAAGLQILHCVKHVNGTGGNTLLTDGFYGATRLKEEFPEDFKFLTNFDVDAEYLEDGFHHQHSAPVILLGSAGDVKQIRFNAYDRSTMAFASSEVCRAYYRSLRNLSRYYENPENQWQFKLAPGDGLASFIAKFISGTVMVMDNFRVLHGRTGFTGTRVLCGSYVARSDWLNKARSLGLIH